MNSFAFVVVIWRFPSACFLDVGLLGYPDFKIIHGKEGTGSYLLGGYAPRPGLPVKVGLGKAEQFGSLGNAHRQLILLGKEYRWFAMGLYVHHALLRG